MQLQEAIKKIFLQVSDVLDQLNCEQYNLSTPVLLKATIGQHVRHIIELFIELENGYETGIVNYDKRKRDHRIETDRFFAKEVLWNVFKGLNKADKQLILELDYSEVSQSSLSVQSNYNRELIYNLEHAVHHMAIIRIGINAVSLINVPENFGIATSTIKHRVSCAQ